MASSKSNFKGAVSSRQELKDYCLRRLGWPVIQINVNDDQVDDRIDDAIQYFQMYHSDSYDKVYISHRLQALDVQRKYIDMSQLSGVGTTTNGSNVIFGTGTNFSNELAVGQEVQIGSETLTVDSIANSHYATANSVWTTNNSGAPITNVTDANSIVGVNRIFPLGSSSTINMFDLRYQLRLNDLYDFTSTSYTNFVITQQHLRTLEMLFTGENMTQFSAHQSKLYISWDWGATIVPGEFVLIEAYKIFKPKLYSAVYNDRYLKQLATAYIKRQWGNNLGKFANVQLLGGVMMNGLQIQANAQEEINKLEDEIQSKYEAPAMFEVG